MDHPVLVCLLGHEVPDVIGGGRTGLHTPADLVGRYDDASWTTRQIFDDILVSVRR